MRGQILIKNLESAVVISGKRLPSPHCLFIGDVLVVDSWKAACRNHEDEGSNPSISILKKKNLEKGLTNPTDRV